MPRPDKTGRWGSNWYKLMNYTQVSCYLPADVAELLKEEMARTGVSGKGPAVTAIVTQYLKRRYKKR